jgi:hypothetical protein
VHKNNQSKRGITPGEAPSSTPKLPKKKINKNPTALKMLKEVKEDMEKKIKKTTYEQAEISIKRRPEGNSKKKF